MKKGTEKFNRLIEDLNLNKLETLDLSCGKQPDWDARFVTTKPRPFGRMIEQLQFSPEGHLVFLTRTSDKAARGVVIQNVEKSDDDESNWKLSYDSKLLVDSWAEQAKNINHVCLLSESQIITCNEENIIEYWEVGKLLNYLNSAYAVRDYDKMGASSITKDEYEGLRPKPIALKQCSNEISTITALPILSDDPLAAKRFAVSLSNGSVLVLDTNGRQIYEIKGTGGDCHSIVVLDAQRFASAHGRNIHIWDVETGRHLKTLVQPMHKSLHVISRLCVMQKNLLVSISAEDRTISLWDLKSGVCLRTIQDTALVKLGQISNAVALSGNVLITASDFLRDFKCYSQIQFWDVHSGKCINSIGSNASSVISSLVLSPRNLLGVGYVDGSVSLIELPSSILSYEQVNKLLARLSDNHSIKTLDLCHTPLSHEQIKLIINALEGHSGITKIHMDDCGLNNSHMAMLLPILASATNKVESVSLAYNDIDEKEIHRLEGLLIEKKLEQSDLSRRPGKEGTIQDALKELSDQDKKLMESVLSRSAGTCGMFNLAGISDNAQVTIEDGGNLTVKLTGAKIEHKTKIDRFYTLLNELVYVKHNDYKENLQQKIPALEQLTKKFFKHLLRDECIDLKYLNHREENAISTLSEVRDELLESANWFFEQAENEDVENMGCAPFVFYGLSYLAVAIELHDYANDPWEKRKQVVEDLYNRLINLEKGNPFLYFDVIRYGCPMSLVKYVYNRRQNQGIKRNKYIEKEQAMEKYGCPSPLHLAVEKGRIDIMGFLLKHQDFQAYIGYYGEPCKTLLHSACLSGSVDIVYYLLSNKLAAKHFANTKKLNLLGTYKAQFLPPLWIAVLEGHYELANYLLDLPNLCKEGSVNLKSSLEYLNHRQETLLFKAVCLEKDINLVEQDNLCEKLLTSGVTVYVDGEEQFNELLCQAIERGLYKTSRALIELKRASLEEVFKKPSYDGKNALYLDILLDAWQKKREPSSTARIIDKEETEVYCQLANYLINECYTKDVLSAGIGASGMNAISRCVEYGEVVLIESLIVRGVAYLDLNEHQAYWPIHVAARISGGENSLVDPWPIINLLLSKEESACPRQLREPTRDEHGKTLLHFAASQGNWRMIALLFKHYNCDVNILDCNGNTALHWLAMHATYPCINPFISEQDFLKTAQLLIDAHTSPLTENENNQTAFDILNAQKNPMESVAYRLEEKKSVGFKLVSRPVKKSRKQQERAQRASGNGQRLFHHLQPSNADIKEKVAERTINRKR